MPASKSGRQLPAKEKWKPMTSAPAPPSQPIPRHLGWLAAVTGLVSIAAVTVLAMTGHDGAAVVVGSIGGGVSTATGIQVTVRVRR